MSTRRSQHKAIHLLSGYPKKMPDGRLALTDWHSNVLGYGRVINSSPIAPGRPGSWISSRRVSYQFNIDGRWYFGRGYGDGIAVNLREFRGPRRS